MKKTLFILLILFSGVYAYSGVYFGPNNGAMFSFDDYRNMSGDASFQIRQGSTFHMQADVYSINPGGDIHLVMELTNCPNYGSVYAYVYRDGRADRFNTKMLTMGADWSIFGYYPYVEWSVAGMGDGLGWLWCYFTY